jgi:hypothetical protein
MVLPNDLRHDDVNLPIDEAHAERSGNLENQEEGSEVGSDLLETIFEPLSSNGFVPTLFNLGGLLLIELFIK